MKKIKRITINKEEDIIDELICNKCGEQLPKIEMGDRHQTHFVGLNEFTYYGGYYSEILNDMESYTFSMCEGCLKELFDSFKIPVDIRRRSLDNILDTHCSICKEEYKNIGDETGRIMMRTCKCEYEQITVGANQITVGANTAFILKKDGT